VDSSNWKWKNICVFGIKRTCRRDRTWFALHSSNLSWVSYNISPSRIDISLRTITSKHLTRCEVLLRCQSYRFIVKWIALLNSWLCCKVDSCGAWLSFEWMSKSNLSWFISAGNKKLFFFFQLHTNVKLLFNDKTIFKTKHRNQLQPEDDIRWTLTTTSPYFDKLVKQTQRQDSHWNLWMWVKFVNVGMMYRIC